jgi:hypothetical protein
MQIEEEEDDDGDSKGRYPWVGITLSVYVDSQKFASERSC